jgi:hypothetical protein
MKCGSSTFNAQSSRVIITAAHVGAVEAHEKKKKVAEDRMNSVHHKN